MSTPQVTPRWRLALQGLGRLLSISLGFLALAGALLAWRSIHSPDYQEHQAVVAHLHEILAREQLYFRSNQVYTADLSNLGLGYAEINGWTFRAIVARDGSTPILLAEASQGERRVALASNGQLYKSFDTSLPRIATFKPDAPVSRPRSGTAGMPGGASGLSSLSDGVGPDRSGAAVSGTGGAQSSPTASTGQEPTTAQELP